MKKGLLVVLLIFVLAFSLTACTNSANDDQYGEGEVISGNENNGGEESNFDPLTEIMVVSREDGSGTRGAFIELFGIEEENEAGETIDRTTVEASITNSTSVMMTTVSGNPYAIGYISLGSMNETVKALQIDGIEATVENIKNGSCPFNIATQANISDLAQDFIDYILSAEGQAVIEDAGYIAVMEGAESYSGSKPAGSIVVAGSSSVTPVMEKLKEAYLAVNPDASIEIQESDSTTGMNSAIEGICDIGMASRELKEEELSVLTPTVIAMDGIAVIVNNECPVEGLTSEEVKSIFIGETLTWDAVVK